MSDTNNSIQQFFLFILSLVVMLIWSGSLSAAALQNSGDVEAGPIWNNNDAKQKCPKVCSDVSATWNGNWKTTVWGSMSVCGCNVSLSCGSNEICKSFVVNKEYNDSGTHANGVCESWVREPCEKGIPNSALHAYEITIRNNKVYYKSTNTLVNSWTGGEKETLYVIDARDNKIYLVNVDGRYIQIRGTANCVGQTLSVGESTKRCSKPRLTTHAGILMGSLAGLPTPNPIPSATAEMMVKVKGAGTIKITNGDIQSITNDSGHFTPTKKNLMETISIFKSAGFAYFPPRGDCTYSFKSIPGKTGVYVQERLEASHCEL